jgi:hypothetical protein
MKSAGDMLKHNKIDIAKMKNDIKELQEVISRKKLLPREVLRVESLEGDDLSRGI